MNATSSARARTPSATRARLQPLVPLPDLVLRSPDAPTLTDFFGVVSDDPGLVIATEVPVAVVVGVVVAVGPWPPPVRPLPVPGSWRPGVGSNAYQPISRPSHTSGQACACRSVTWYLPSERSSPVSYPTATRVGRPSERAISPNAAANCSQNPVCTLNKKFTSACVPVPSCGCRS